MDPMVHKSAKAPTEKRKASNEEVKVPKLSCQRPAPITARVVTDTRKRKAISDERKLNRSECMFGERRLHSYSDRANGTSTQVRLDPAKQPRLHARFGNVSGIGARAFSGIVENNAGITITNGADEPSGGNIGDVRSHSGTAADVVGAALDQTGASVMASRSDADETEQYRPLSRREVGRCNDQGICQDFYANDFGYCESEPASHRSYPLIGRQVTSAGDVMTAAETCMWDDRQLGRESIQLGVEVGASCAVRGAQGWPVSSSPCQLLNSASAKRENSRVEFELRVTELDVSAKRRRVEVNLRSTGTTGMARQTFGRQLVQPTRGQLATTTKAVGDAAVLRLLPSCSR